MMNAIQNERTNYSNEKEKQKNKYLLRKRQITKGSKKRHLERKKERKKEVELLKEANVK